MKNLKQITEIIFILLILFSCKKEKPIPPFDKNITLTGKIVKNCAGYPLANHPVQIFLYYGVYHKENAILEAKTDSNGNFKWTFTVEEEGCNISIRPAGMADILTFDSDIRNLGTIIATPTCNVVMKIKVNNSYSVGDTLQLKDYLNHTFNPIRIGAPFKDTILPVSYNYAELKWPSSFEEKNTTYVETNIYISRN